MKATPEFFRNQLKQSKIFLKREVGEEKKYQTKHQLTKQSRIVQSINNAGHTRGGHQFH